MDCSLLGSSIHGIFQARVLERVAISFSRGSSQPRDETLVLGWEDPLEKGMATDPSILIWRILWTEEPSAIVHRVEKSQTQLKQPSMHTGSLK